MAYGVSIYYNDADIASTRFYTENGDIDLVKNYGSSSYSAYGVNGSGFSGTAVFEATPAAGCVFTQWVYRLSSDPDTVLTSTDNPFRHTSGVDIEIRAEGASPPTAEGWELYPVGSFNSIKGLTSAEFELVENEMIVYSVTFAYSGLATFYTTGSVDTYGYLGDKEPVSVFDYDDGVPKTYLIFADDAGAGDANFAIQWVVSPNTTYYVWIRGYKGDETGLVRLYIDPPTASVTWSEIIVGHYPSLESSYSDLFTLEKYKIYRYTVTFARSGTAVFYTEGSVDTYGFVGTSSSDITSGGAPASYDYSNDDGGDNRNFKISINVKANTTYYVWIKSVSYAEGSVKFVMEAPSATQNWVVTSTIMSDPLTEDMSRTLILSNYDMRCISVSFANSGKAYFYAISTGDLVGYLSSGSSTAADTANGKPSSYDAYEDDRLGAYGRSFRIGYDVIAGDTYHIWVRCKDATASTTATLHIIAPGEFAWTYPKNKGEEFNLTAAEWNRLMYRIDLVRRNKTTSGYRPAEVVKGDEFTALMYNQACAAIKKVDGYGVYLPTAVEGEPVTASAMDIIVSELNAIPKE